MTIPAAARGLALAALACLAGCALYPVGNPDATVEVAPGGLPSTLALAPEPSWPVVEVSLDGEPGFRFLVDSGAMASVLFVHDRTRALAARATGRVSVGGAGAGARAQASLRRDATIGLGAVTLRNMTLLAIDAAAVPRLGDADAFDLDGIIGHDLLSRFAVRVDPRARTLALLAPGAPPPPGAAVVPLESRHAMVYVELPIAVAAGEAPRPANLHVDTGFDGHLQLVDAAGSPFPVPDRGWTSVGAGVQGETRGIVATVASVGIADGAIVRVPAVWSRGDAASGRHGRLGAALLARFAYTIDVPNGRLVLEPRDDSFAPPPQGYVGLSLAPAAEGARVRFVQPGAPAAQAGLAARDRVVSIDGAATQGLTRRALAERLQGEPGRRLELCRREAGTVDCRAIVAGDLAQGPPVEARAR